MICKSNTKNRALFGLAVNNDNLLVGRGPWSNFVRVARWLAGKFLHFPLLAPWPTTKTPGKVSVGKKKTSPRTVPSVGWVESSPGFSQVRLTTTKVELASTDDH